jgi:uncharacterized protein YdgA (DUF945 family)
MKRTLRVALPVCLAVIAIYCGASYWLGVQACQQYDRLIAQINRSNLLAAVPGDYKRGLFSSSALTAFTLTRPGNEGSVTLDVVSSIHHGPFVFLNDSHFKGGLRPVLAVIKMKPALTAAHSDDALKKVLEAIPELESTEVLSIFFIDGSGETYLDVPPFQKKVPDANGGQLDAQWSGLAAKSQFDARFEEITGSWSSPFFQIAGPNKLIVRMKDFNGDFNSHSGIKGISVGSAALSVASIEGSEKDKSPFSLTSFGIKTESGVSGETIGGSLLLSFDRLDAGGMAFGPFAMELEARKLDAEVLSRFEKLVRNIEAKAASGGQNDVSEPETEKAAEAILLELLAKSPEFEIKQLKLNTEKGDLSGRAKLGFAFPMGIPSQNILLLIASTDASAELSISEALGYFAAENLLRDAGQDAGSAKTNAEAIVKGLMDAKYVTSEGGSLKSSAAFKHGSLTINGRKLDLSSLKQFGK